VHTILKVSYMQLNRLIVIPMVLVWLAASAAGASDQRRHPGQAGHTDTGAAAFGFAVSLNADNLTVPVGGPIWVTVELRNVSGTLQHATAGARANFDFVIVGRGSARAVPRKRDSLFGLDSIGGPALGWPVPADTSIFLPFRLDQMYTFAQPGTYEIRVVRSEVLVNGSVVHLPASNQISLTLI
jgi:hypothetical protein